VTFFYCTNSITLRLVCNQKSTMNILLIDNNGSTTQLSTIIFCTIRRRHTTMSLMNLLHELDVFTTRVKTKTVPALCYSTSIIMVQYKSLRRNFIPCHQLLLVFLFFVVPEFKFFTARTRSKIRPKNQIFEKFHACKNGLGGHVELANDAYNRQKGVKFSLSHAQFIYTSSCQMSKCPATSSFDSLIFNFHARTRFLVVY